MRVSLLPLLLSIGLHTILLGAIASGTFFPDAPKPDPPDIFTVELIPVAPKEVMRNETKDEDWPKEEPEIILNETPAEALAENPPASLDAPPTPTGKPLVFEKTISFQPFETGWPPIYKYDCIPDPPKRPYPWAWDGVSTPNPPGYEAVKQARVEPSAPPPTECPDAPEDSLEAEAADMQRQFDMWESSRLKSQK